MVKTAVQAESIADSLVSWWPFKGVGEPNRFLYIGIVRERKSKTFRVHQQSYINACVAKYGVTRDAAAPANRYTSRMMDRTWGSYLLKVIYVEALLVS